MIVRMYSNYFFNPKFLDYKKITYLKKREE